MTLNSSNILNYLSNIFFPEDDWQRVSRISEMMMKERTNEHRNPKNLYRFVSKDNLEGLQAALNELSKKNSESTNFACEAVMKADALGATVIHFAYLLKKYKIGRWLVENYPTEALMPYSSTCNEKVKDLLKKDGYDVTEKDMPYSGENILHMTIIHKNHTETRWLLDFYYNRRYDIKWGLETLLLEDTKGRFFSDRHGSFYFGCFPLHFAVCSNDTDMFDLILNYTSSLDGDALDKHRKTYSEMLERREEKLRNENMKKNGRHKLKYRKKSDGVSSNFKESGTYSNNLANILTMSSRIRPTTSNFKGEQKNSEIPRSAVGDSPFEQSPQNADGTTTTSPSSPNNNKPLIRRRYVLPQKNNQNAIESTGGDAINVDFSLNEIDETMNILGTNQNTYPSDQPHPQPPTIEESATSSSMNAYHQMRPLGSAAIFMRDQGGNNCLHLAVTHHLHEMYKHIIKSAEAMIKSEIMIGYSDHLLSGSDEKFFYLKQLPQWDSGLEGTGLLQKEKEKQKPKSGILSPNLFSFLSLGWARAKVFHFQHSDGIQKQMQAPQVQEHLEPCKEIWNNGFRYGYSPKETAVSMPPITRNGDGDTSKQEAIMKQWLQEEMETKLNQRLYFVLNEELHTPLTLGAAGLRVAQGEEHIASKSARDTLQFLIGDLKELRWSYGPVKCSLIDLEGLDMPINVKRYEDEAMKVRPLPSSESRRMFGAIEWICITDSDQCITIPEVKKLVTDKWERFGKRLFLMRFYIHIALTFCITFMSCFVNETPTMHHKTSAELAVTILYPITGIIILFLVMLELPNVCRHRLDYWGLLSKDAVRGAAQFDNVVFTVMVISYLSLYISQYVAYKNGSANVYATYEPTASPSPLSDSVTISSTSSTIDYISDHNISVKFSMTISVITSWMYVYYFLMGLDTTGAFVLSIYRIVTKDIPFFMTFYILIVMAFGLAISLLTNDGDPSASYGIIWFLRAIWALFQITVQVGSNDSVVDLSTISSDLLWLGEIVITCYYMSVFILMLNLLIAMMTDTYSFLQTCSESLLLIEKYNIMSGMTQSLISVEQQFPFSYFNRWLNIVNASDIQKKYAILIPHLSKKDDGDGEGEEKKEDTADKEKDMDILSIVDAFHLPKKEEPAEDMKFERFAFEIKESVANWYQSRDAVKPEDRHKKTVLLLIDPQNDFLEGGQVSDRNSSSSSGGGYLHPPGSIAIPGTMTTSRLISDMIRSNAKNNNIEEIIVTMQTHSQRGHITQAACWECGTHCPSCNYNRGSAPSCHPVDFDVISQQDIEDDRWKPINGLDNNFRGLGLEKEWCLEYVTSLKKKGSELMIWPEHCIEGTMGHAIIPNIDHALKEWKQSTGKKVIYIKKGVNPRTLTYSAVKAEVEDLMDRKTFRDERLLRKLKIADRVIVVGPMLSHGVRYTVRDFIEYWQFEDIKKLVLLEDAYSVLPQFAKEASDFLAEVKAKGVTITTTTSVFHKDNNDHNNNNNSKRNSLLDNSHTKVINPYAADIKKEYHAPSRDEEKYPLQQQQQQLGVVTANTTAMMSERLTQLEESQKQLVAMAQSHSSEMKTLMTLVQSQLQSYSGQVPTPVPVQHVPFPQSTLSSTKLPPLTNRGVDPPAI